MQILSVFEPLRVVATQVFNSLRSCKNEQKIEKAEIVFSIKQPFLPKYQTQANHKATRF